MSRYESRTRFNGNRGRKSGATFKWKKSPSNKSKRKSGEYNHVDVEQEMLQSNQLNKEENKANNVVDDDDDEDRSNYVIKKGIYYHHDRQKKKYSNNFDGMYNNNNNNNNYRRKDKENINRNNAGLMRKNGKELKKSKLTRVNRRGMVYSNDFERGLLESRKSRKRNKIPMPYPPNYPNKNDTYEQPYIDSPPVQARRRQQRSGQRYYNKHGQQVPRTSGQALMQLRYEAQNAATTAQALYEQEYRNVNIGTYLDDGSWYPFPDPRLRGVKDTRKKPPKIQKPPPVKFDAQYVYDPLTPGQKVNRVQNTLEYYFSEANMLYDNHLRSLCDAEGWVTVKKLENFPRMIKFGAKADIIVEAAYHSNFIEVKNNKYLRMKVGWEKYIPDHLKKKINKTNKNNKNKISSNSNNNNNNNKSKAKTSEAKDNLLNITNANKKKNTNQKNKASDDVKKVKKKKVKAHDKREHLNLVLIGHVDAGKSTISGQILLQTGQIDQRTIDKYKREAKDKNRESWWIAYIMDEDNEERAKGKTVECGRAHFDTSNKRYTILDAPGHKNYVPNMIQGATQADVALLVISARQNEFEAGFNRGGQTREHALLAYTLGITRIVVIVNKIDSCNYSQERYQEIVTAIKKFLSDIGFKSKYVEFLPLSGQSGINIINDDNNQLSWYNGKTLIKCLDELPKMKRKNNNPLRIPVLDKYKGDKGIMIIGKLEAGTLSINDYVKVEPAGRDFKILTIEIDDVAVENAKSGENVLLGIGNTQISMDQIFSGSVISSIQNPVPVSTKFIAQIYVNELPNKSIMTKGYQAMFHCHNISCNCEIIDIPHKINKKNGKKSKIAPPFLRTHESAIASIKLSNKYPIESFDNCNQLGRFTLRDSGRTCVIGKISQVL